MVISWLGGWDTQATLPPTHPQNYHPLTQVTPMGKTCSHPASLQGGSAANATSKDRPHHLQTVTVSFRQQICVLSKCCVTHAATGLVTQAHARATQPWPRRMHVLAKETNTNANKSI